MATITKSDIGRTVIYKPWPEAPRDQWERGIITSIRSEAGIVFVRYGINIASKATNPDDLEFEFPTEEDK